MITKRDLDEELRVLEQRARTCRLALRGAGKGDFMARLADVETAVKAVRALVIRYSRGIKQGVRKDGQPDKRFAMNKRGGQALDLRRSLGS